MNKKKLIKKCQPGNIIEKSDNTRVQMPRTDVEPIKIPDEELKWMGWIEQTYPDGETYMAPPLATGALTQVNPEFDLLTGFRGALTSGLLDDVSWFVRHPRAKKVYHGSADKFDLRDARTASEGNIGIHVSPNKEIAESFALRNRGVINEAYMPGHDATTIDIWDNDARLLSNAFKREARNYTDDAVSTGYYYGDDYWFNLLEKHGADPKWRYLDTRARCR